MPDRGQMLGGAPGWEVACSGAPDLSLVSAQPLRAAAERFLVSRL